MQTHSAAIRWAPSTLTVDGDDVFTGDVTSCTVVDPDVALTAPSEAADLYSQMDLVFWSILNELYPDASLDAYLTTNGI